MYFVFILCRFHLQSLRHLKCTSFRIQRTRNLFVCWASRSVYPRFCTKMTKKIRHNLSLSAAVNAPLTSLLHGSGIKDREVSVLAGELNWYVFEFQRNKVYTQLVAKDNRMMIWPPSAAIKSMHRGGGHTMWPFHSCTQVFVKIYRVTHLLVEKVMLASVPSQDNLGMSWIWCQHTLFRKQMGHPVQ